MRHLKRIGFFLYSCLLLAGGFFGHIRFEAAFYPGRETAFSLPSAAGEEAVSAVSAKDGRISADTQLILRKRGLMDGEIEESEEDMPVKYIGLDREGLLLCVQDEMASPLLAERSEGLVSMQVVSFSADRIVIEKTYRRKREDDSFYLSLEDNRVVIREGEGPWGSVYLRTDLDARELPAALRSGLVKGMTLEGTEELENFLVSYPG